MEETHSNKKYIFVFLIFIVLIGLIVFFRLAASRQSDRSKEPVPTSVVPTYDQGEVERRERTRKGSFIVERHEPTDRVIKTTNRDVPITFIFSEFVKLEDLSYSLTPHHEVKLDNYTGRIVTFRPYLGWSYDIDYKLKILKNTKSTKNNFLGEDYEINLRLEIPEEAAEKWGLYAD